MADFKLRTGTTACPVSIGGTPFEWPSADINVELTGRLPGVTVNFPREPLYSREVVE